MKLLIKMNETHSFDKVYQSLNVQLGSIYMRTVLQLDHV